jgi:hypothetical protein
MNVLPFRSKREIVRRRKRSEVLEVLAPYIEKAARAGSPTPCSNSCIPILMNQSANFQVLGASTQHGFYMRVDICGRHVFTAYRGDGGTRVATWKRGDWEAEIFNVRF